MTRIIAGRAGGRRLRTPPGTGTRPTSDRVREALFSAVESAFGSLEGLRVLDLYAGSGALGLEAWSRGAAAVTLVEADRRTAGLVRANAADLGCAEADVVAGSVATVLGHGPGADGAFDLVLADPPYPLGDDEVTRMLSLLVQHGWLVADAMVVLERSSRSPAPRWPAGLEGGRSRRYGETTLHVAHGAADAPR